MLRHPLKIEITLDKITPESFGMVNIQSPGRYHYFAIDEDGELRTFDKEHTRSDLAFCKAVAKLVRKVYGDRVGSLL